MPLGTCTCCWRRSSHRCCRVNFPPRMCFYIPLAALNIQLRELSPSPSFTRVIIWLTLLLSFACAAYRRNTNFIRVPTTVIGLIDASVSIKVAVNYGNYKNRLGAYHAPIHTFLDFTFLRSLPIAQVRNGFAELIKISSCSHLQVFNLLDKYCEQLIEHKFGRGDGATPELKQAADIVRSFHASLSTSSYRTNVPASDQPRGNSRDA